MENLKKGDIVRYDGKPMIIDYCFESEVIESHVGMTLVKTERWLLTEKLRVVKKSGESQMQYEESNRYKLAQAIQKTGISAKALSRAVVGNESYFYNKTGVARFNKKGDISNEVLNLALADLAFAEREVLGVGAKVVEEPNKETICAIDAECDSDVFLTAQDLANSVEEKQTSNKSLFIGAAVVIFIALILFILNNYLQVV